MRAKRFPATLHPMRSGILLTSSLMACVLACTDGIRGEAGPQGPKGEQGAQGPQGLPGSDGTSPHVVWKDATGVAVERVAAALPLGDFPLSDYTLGYFDEQGYLWALSVFDGNFYSTFTALPYYTTTDCSGTAYFPLSTLYFPTPRAVFDVPTIGYRAFPDSWPAGATISAASRRNFAGACEPVSSSPYAVPIPPLALTPPTTDLTPPLHPELVP